VAVPLPTTGDLGGGGLSFTTDNTSQGCQATSLYAPSAFQVPYGSSLPYIIALDNAGIENPPFNPYAETTQSTNLRQIQSALLPTYRAKNDTLEYNATYTINPALTLTSQTGFNQDFLWSTEDYNRFDTTPGIFNGTGIPRALTNGTTQSFYSQLYHPDPAVPGAFIFCDPQLGCSDRLVAEDLDEEHARQASQEFRLASNFSGTVNFSVGANFLHYETEENYYVFANAFTAYSYSLAGGGIPAHARLLAIAKSVRRRISKSQSRFRRRKCRTDVPLCGHESDRLAEQ